MGKDKYGFDKTSTTLVEKLSRGEDWERFCALYAKPIREKFNACNLGNGGGACISDVDQEDALAKIFEKLKVKLAGKYDPDKGHLRNWLSRVIRNAVVDYCKEVAGNRSQLTFDKPDEDGKTHDPRDKEQLREFLSNNGDLEWISYLKKTALYMACERHPWQEKTKMAIMAICENAQRPKGDQLTNDELARSLSMTGANMRKICERLRTVAKKYLNEFRNDDPEFFAYYAKEHDIPFDLREW